MKLGSLQPSRPEWHLAWIIWSFTLILTLSIDCTVQEELPTGLGSNSNQKPFYHQKDWSHPSKDAHNNRRLKNKHNRGHSRKNGHKTTHFLTHQDPPPGRVTLADPNLAVSLEENESPQATQFEYPRNLITPHEAQQSNSAHINRSWRRSGPRGSGKKRKTHRVHKYPDDGNPPYPSKFIKSRHKAKHESDARGKTEQRISLEFIREPNKRNLQKANHNRKKSSSKSHLHRVPKADKLRQPPPHKEKGANIILMMTDDLDVELGSLSYMPRLLQLLGDKGALFPNAYTSTPMCCPSRSSMLTGMYIHNHEIYTNQKNCSGTHWQKTHERRSFAAYLKNAGYKTGYFGKYLNRYNGSHVPPGWGEWAGLVGNSRYYNYTVNRNSHHVKYGNKYPQDYFPHVITTDGINFLRENQKDGDDSPFMMVLSYPAPHGPEDSAPEHSHKFFNASDHHTASYNYAPNTDKQWMLQFTNRMPDIQLKFTDLLMTKRLQTLQSIDESIEKIVNELDSLGLWKNTYLFFTSDHGYHLGQFGLAKGKSMPFEFDIKIPLFVRGPNIQEGSLLPNIALNIDLAPTFLDIAGLQRPPQMDGRSLLPVFKASKHPEDERKVGWRDSFLVESSGRLREEEELEKKEQRTWERERAITKQLIDATAASLNGSDDQSGNGHSVNLYTSKHERFGEVCKRSEFSSPCSPMQKWHCVETGSRWRIKKCRQKNDLWQKHCICQSPHGFGTYRKLDPIERRKQRNFLKKYLTKNLHSLNAKFIKIFSNSPLPDVYSRHYANPTWKTMRKRRFSKRYPRSAATSMEIATEVPFPQDIEEAGPQSSHDGQYDKSAAAAFSPPSMELNFNQALTDDNVQAFIEEEELRDLEDQIHEISDELQSLENASGTVDEQSLQNKTLLSNEPNIHHGCQANDGLIDCQEEVYENIDTWLSSKIAIEDHIRRLRQQLALMKNIHKHLQLKRPAESQVPIELEIFDYENGNESVDVEENTQIVQEADGIIPPPDDDAIIPLNSIDESQTEVPTTQSPVETTTIEDLEAEQTLTLDNLASKPVKPKGGNGRRHKFKTASRSHNLNSQNLRLFPVPMSSLLDEFSVLENEASEPLCWCDKRIAKKLQIQHERALKREERQKDREQRLNKKRKRRMRRKHKQISDCNLPTLNCYTHDNAHWRTPPLWTDGTFCFCINAANNTYWCLRTINETHNFLYCEFITGLITYYDLHIDPYQLRNVAFTLSNERVIELHAKLQKLRVCKGADDCDGIDPPPRSVTTEVPKTDELNISQDENDGISTIDNPKDNSVIKNANVDQGYFVVPGIPNYKVPYSKRRKYYKFHERERKRKRRKEKKKYKKNKLKESRLERVHKNAENDHGWRQKKVRLPRKSRRERLIEKGEKRERQRRKRRRKVHNNN